MNVDTRPKMDWLELHNPESVASPGLIVDPDRILKNIMRMIAMVGGMDHVSRLRTHVKTHKMAEVARMQRDVGISKFKAATIAEASLVAAENASDVLLAYQPVGPNLERLAGLVTRFPETSFAAITDDLDVARSIANRLGNNERPFRLLIDVDCGMHRTGIAMGTEMDRLRDAIESMPGIRFDGLHVYDGHIHDPSSEARHGKASQIITTLRGYQEARPVDRIIGGGSPTFGTWASETSWECSPGTPPLWDIGYGTAHPDLEFSIAAALLTRVISKPGSEYLCLDLGYKSIASEMPLDRRVYFPDLPDAELVGQSEEHLVVKTSRAAELPVGHPLLGFPRHICPTVALHALANVIRDGNATGEQWRVAARDRC